METTPDEIILNCKKAEKGDQGRYNVTLRNPKGIDSANINVVVKDKPGSPEGPLKVSDITPEGCKLAWEPPLVSS